MPAILLPIIAGAANLMRLPALVAFLAGIFGQIVAFFAKWVSTKIAMQLTILTALVGLTVAVFTGIRTIMLGISVIAPDYLVQAASLVVPDNAALCLSSIISANVIRYVWVWKVYFIESFGRGK